MADETRGPIVWGVAEPGHLLLRAGILLLLIGLLTGFAIPAMAVPRLGLSSHLEGVMNGMLLAILGLIWPRLRLGPLMATTTLIAALYGAYANWAATLLAAIWSAGALMPIAAQGHTGTPLAEAIVGALLASLSAAMIRTCLATLWGLRK